MKDTRSSTKHFCDSIYETSVEISMIFLANFDNEKQYYMCFYYQLSAKAQELEHRFEKKIPELENYTKNTWVNAFEHPSMPVILKESDEIQFYEWGLIPHWAKDESIHKYTLNARIETIAEKPSFRDAIQQPCLVPATGFYEWQWLDVKGKEKQKYLIRNTTIKLFSFAGIYSNWLDKSTGEIRNTYSILTTQANKLMEKVHNTKKRMPIILHPKDEAIWLAGKDYKQFAFPYETSLQTFLI